MAKHHMYDESPILKHEEAGHVKVAKTPKSEEGDGPKEKGVAGEGFHVEATHSHERLALHHKHMHEHMQLHHKQEVEHHHHEGKVGELHKKHYEQRKEMHAHHEHEMKAMHTRHEKEAGASGGSTDGEPIKKIEKDKYHG